jgi:hypothetical protein
MNRGPWTPPPNWPKPEPGWEPPPGWSPRPEWGPPPTGWNFYPHREPPVSWWRRHWLHLLAVGLLGLLIGASLSPSDATTPTASKSQAPRPTASVTVTVTPSVAADTLSSAEAMALRRKLTAARQDLKTERKSESKVRHRLANTQTDLRRTRHERDNAITAAKRAARRASSAQRQLASTQAARRQAQSSPAPARVSPTHSCTHTSSGSCIQGGEFCPNASDGLTGYDANGRAHVCRDDHWRVP